MSDSTRTPYQKLGARLRSLRNVSQESTAEVSSAVEIDEELLQLIEVGSERPSEDILMLLLSHYGVGEDRADELWKLAGYERQASDDEDDDVPFGPGPSADAKQHTMMVMLDPRVMYSDSFEITASKQGVIFGFGQLAGPTGQPLTISRVGMSREQAKTVMGLLHKALWDLDNPAPDTKPKDDIK
jgi:transcriptional regulator with XRE-family HTH domain